MTATGIFEIKGLESAIIFAEDLSISKLPGKVHFESVLDEYARPELKTFSSRGSSQPDVPEAHGSNGSEQQSSWDEMSSSTPGADVLLLQLEDALSQCESPYGSHINLSQSALMHQDNFGGFQDDFQPREFSPDTRSRSRSNTGMEDNYELFSPSYESDPLLMDQYFENHVTTSELNQAYNETQESINEVSSTQQNSGIQLFEQNVFLSPRTLLTPVPTLRDY